MIRIPIAMTDAAGRMRTSIRTDGVGVRLGFAGLSRTSL
jgi:hypothetical protein